jgi:hypothetical protein
VAQSIRSALDNVFLRIRGCKDGAGGTLNFERRTPNNLRPTFDVRRSMFDVRSSLRPPARLSLEQEGNSVGVSPNGDSDAFIGRGGHITWNDIYSPPTKRLKDVYQPY